MKLFHNGVLPALLVWMGALAAVAAASQTNDMLWLDGGERLRGELLGIRPDQTVVWRHPEIAEELTFPLTSVLKVRLGARPIPETRATNACIVRFTNRDEIEAEVIGIDDTNLVLNTWFAGRFQVPRGLVDCVQPIVDNPRIVFEGPTGLEGWTLGNSAIPGVESNAWVYSQGALVAVSSGSIARDVKLPNLACLDFDIAWANYLQIAIALYADSLQPVNLATKDEAPEFGGFYSLQLNANTVNILAVKKGAPLNSLGMGIVPGMESKTSAHVTVRASRPDRAVYLYLDGVLAKEWRDPVDTLGQGTCLRIVNQVPNPFKLSNLVISEWDGRMDMQSPGNQNAALDFVRLLNRDTVSANVIGLHGGNVVISNATGRLEIPLQRIEQIHFSQQGRSLARNAGGECTALFARRGRLLLKVQSWEKQQVVALNPNLGKIQLDAAALRMLELKTPAPEVR